MAEIDFDELDKAVNSLMSGVKQPAKSGTPTKDDAAVASAPSAEQPGPADSEPESQEEAVAVTVNPKQNETAAESDNTDDTLESDEQHTETAGEPSPDAAAAPVQVSATDDSRETAQVVPQQSTVEQDTAATEPQPEQKSLAAKRRGQFMDMKHPSANMKTTPVDVVKPPHVGVTITPPSATEAHSAQTEGDPAKEEPVVQLDTVEIEVPEVPLPEEKSDETGKADLQDSPSNDDASSDEPKLTPAPEREVPAEALSQDEPETETEATPVQADEAPRESVPKANSESSLDDKPENTQTAAEATPAASTSPFLPDAKVDKRPLGVALTDELKPAGDDTSENPAALPEELHDSVLAVEADTTITKSPVPNEQEAVANDEPDNTDATTDDTATTPASIPAQYKTNDETAKDAKSSDTSLYDSAGQHDAFASSPKRSHWAVVLGIIIIIVLGAAIGAGAYVLQAGLL